MVLDESTRQLAAHLGVDLKPRDACMGYANCCVCFRCDLREELGRPLDEREVAELV